MNIFRRLKLGGMYHNLYQKWWSNDQRVKELEGSVRKLEALAERRLTACKSLEKQKTTLTLKIEARDKQLERLEAQTNSDHSLIDRLLNELKEVGERRQELTQELTEAKKQYLSLKRRKR